MCTIATHISDLAWVDPKGGGGGRRIQRGGGGGGGGGGGSGKSQVTRFPEKF